MAVDSQDALARMQQMSRMSAVASSQSIYTSASQLAEYGWTAIQEKITWSQLGLQEVMNSLGIAEDDGKVSPGQHNELWDLTQDEEKTIQGVEYPVRLCHRPLSFLVVADIHDPGNFGGL